MSYYRDSIMQAVENKVVIRYVGKDDCSLWNNNRRGDELRLVTGWMWYSKDRKFYKQGLKTHAAAVRDAYYTVLEHRKAPGVAPSTGPRLVHERKRA